MLQVGFYPFRGPDASSTRRRSYHALFRSERLKRDGLKRIADREALLLRRPATFVPPFECGSLWSRSRGAPVAKFHP